MQSGNQSAHVFGSATNNLNGGGIPSSSSINGMKIGTSDNMITY